MYTVPPAPRKPAKQKPRARRNGVSLSVSQILQALGILFVFYICIVLGSKLVKMMQYSPQNLTVANQKTGLILLENSCNFSGELPQQLEIFHSNSRPVGSSGFGQGEDEFELQENGNERQTNVEFVVAAEDNIASSKNYSGAGDLNNITLPDLPGNEDSTTYAAGATTTGGDVDYENDYISASDPVSGENEPPAGDDSTSNHNGDGVISESTSTEETSNNPQVHGQRKSSSPRADFSGPVSLASRVRSLLAAAAEAAKKRFFGK